METCLDQLGVRIHLFYIALRKNTARVEQLHHQYPDISRPRPDRIEFMSRTIHFKTYSAAFLQDSKAAYHSLAGLEWQATTRKK